MNLDVLILRDPRESPKKCSLTPLRGRPGVQFVEFKAGRRIDGEGRILLHPDGPELSGEDVRGAGGIPCAGLLLLDCSWRRLPSLLAAVDGEPVRRRLPPLFTAYPRKSQVFQDPDQGLASIEALYAAFALLGEPRPDLLEGYRWRAEFLERNPELV